MPRQATRLNMHFVLKMILLGKYYNENGLILLVKETGAKSCACRLTICGGRRNLGLGPSLLVTLGESCQAACDNPKPALAGSEPHETRAKRLNPTFRETATVIKDRTQGRGAGRESRTTARPDDKA